MDRSGNTSSLRFCAGAGAGVAGCAPVRGWGVTIGDRAMDDDRAGTDVGNGAECVTGRGAGEASAPVSLSSKRRSSSRSNPANLVFTPFDIAHSFSRGLFVPRLCPFQQEARHEGSPNSHPALKLLSARAPVGVVPALDWLSTKRRQIIVPGCDIRNDNCYHLGVCGPNAPGLNWQVDGVAAESVQRNGTAP